MNFTLQMQEYIKAGGYPVYQPGSTPPVDHGWVLPDGRYIDIEADDHHGIENFMGIEDAIVRHCITIHYGCGYLWIRTRDGIILPEQRWVFQHLLDHERVTELLVHEYPEEIYRSYSQFAIHDRDEIKVFLLDPIGYQIMLAEKQEAA